MARTTSQKQTKLTSDGRAEDLLEKRRRNCETLVRLIERIGQTSGVSEVVGVFLDAAVAELKVKRAAACIALPGMMRLEPVVQLGTNAETALPSIARQSGFVRWLKETGGPAHIDEFFAVAGEFAGEEEEMIRPLIDEEFAYALPFAGLSGLVGILFYCGKAAGGAFDEGDEELLTMFSRALPVEIERAFACDAAAASKLEIEQFANMKRTLIGETSRDLRTPLTVLKSTLWSLEPDQVDGGVLVSMAKDAVSRLQAEIDYLLSLNEIGLDGAELKLEASEISSIVEDVLRELLPELEEKQVRVEVDDKVPYRKVLIDPGKIAIVVRSLLENAIDSVGRGGGIEVSIRVSETPPGSADGVAIGGPTWQRRGADRASFIVVSVKDDGIGIPPSEIATLAEPFTEASNSTNREVKGLGIGLSVSQKVIAGHGGAIYCKSDLGQGAQFSIWLPLDA